MNRVERPALQRRVDDARNVALRRALGNRVDVDVVPAERVEQLSRNAGRPLHAFADDGEDGLSGFVIDDHQAIVHLVPKLLLDGVDPARRVHARTAKQIVCSDEACEIRMMLTGGRKRPEQPLGDARHAHHSRTAQRQERQIPDRRDALRERVARLACGWRSACRAPTD